MERDEYIYNERKRIGNILQSARKSQGLTILQLSEKTGFNTSNISRIENGKYNLSIDVLSVISRELNIRLEFSKALD